MSLSDASITAQSPQTPFMDRPSNKNDKKSFFENISSNSDTTIDSTKYQKNNQYVTKEINENCNLTNNQCSYYGNKNNHRNNHRTNYGKDTTDYSNNSKTNHNGPPGTNYVHDPRTYYDNDSTAHGGLHRTNYCHAPSTNDSYNYTINHNNSSKSKYGSTFTASYNRNSSPQPGIGSINAEYPDFSIESHNFDLITNNFNISSTDYFTANLSALDRTNTKLVPRMKTPILDDLVVIRTIGTGTFGRVFLVRYQNKHYALKRVLKRHLCRNKQLDNLYQEKKALTDLFFCKYFVKHIHCFKNDNAYFFLMEYIAGGELFFWLRKYGTFFLPAVRFYAAEIVLALEYLFNKGFVYRDLKPENILLTETGHIKLIDLGFAKQIKNIDCSKHIKHKYSTSLNRKKLNYSNCQCSERIDHDPPNDKHSNYNNLGNYDFLDHQHSTDHNFKYKNHKYEPEKKKIKNSDHNNGSVRKKEIYNQERYLGQNCLGNGGNYKYSDSPRVSQVPSVISNSNGSTSLVNNLQEESNQRHTSTQNNHECSNHHLSDSVDSKYDRKLSKENQFTGKYFNDNSHNGQNPSENHGSDGDVTSNCCSEKSFEDNFHHEQNSRYFQCSSENTEEPLTYGEDSRNNSCSIQNSRENSYNNKDSRENPYSSEHTNYNHCESTQTCNNKCLISDEWISTNQYNNEPIECCPECSNDNFSYGGDLTYTMCGTAEYMAPEKLLGTGYGMASDIWTLGILMYEMLMGKGPFIDESDKNLYKKILYEKIEYARMDLIARDLISQLLIKEPINRLCNIRIIKKHLFFKGIFCYIDDCIPPIIPQLHNEGDSSHFIKYSDKDYEEFGGEEVEQLFFSFE